MPGRPEYNPNIIGFHRDRGPVIISLTDARRKFGQLPSDYHFVSPKDGRKNKKGLNLALGKLVTEKLNRGGSDLKRIVYDFFKGWHRDYEKEFDVAIDRFFNLNDASAVAAVMDGNREVLSGIAARDLREFLGSEGLIRRDILNSIDNAHLSLKAEGMLARKLKGSGKNPKLEEALALIRARRIIGDLKERTGLDLSDPNAPRLSVYSDEVAKSLLQLAGVVPVPGTERLEGVRGEGVEFEYAARDRSYLMLGKETGDCTSDKSPFQADRDVENIYWTVFPWILDRNYQILKVHVDGIFVMKVHLLPLFILDDTGGFMVLAVDAVETVRAFRDDLEGSGKEALLGRKEYIFGEVMDKIGDIATRMGMEHVYAEKFSNTRWVREAFDRFPEIYLHVNHIVKLDELEDVFTLAGELGRDTGFSPEEIFMELQMKNTSLVPLVSSRAKGVKPFSVIRGDAERGIQMKRVVGI